MDKDEFFKIFEEECCYNINNLFMDLDWALQSSIAHNSKIDEFEKHKRTEQDEKIGDINSINISKQANLQYNMIKPYESLLSDTQFFQRYKKLAESKKQEKSHKLANENISNNEKFFEKRISYFEKLTNSNAHYRYKINKLGFHSNYLLEKYSILQDYSLDKLPGLKPSSSWPVNLNDLISHLFNLDLFQMFHTPFDLNSDFNLQALEFIEKYYFYYLQSLAKLKSDALNLTEVDNKTLECENILYEESLIKAIATLFTVKLMQGNFTQLFSFLKSLKQIFNNLGKEKLNNFECLNLPQINNQLLIRSLNDKMDQSNKNLNLPKYFLKNLLAHLKEKKILPIMRNYSILDITSIPKNILFTPLRHVFSNCSSITTDSKYLYIILSGVNGGMIKLGTGYNKTIKGKVYLHVKFTDSNLFILNNPNLANASSTNSNSNSAINNNSTISSQNPSSTNNQTLSAAAANPITNTIQPQQQNQTDSSQNTNQNANIPLNPNPNPYILNDDASYQWVYLKGKLYLKQNSNANNYLGSSSAFAAFPGAQAHQRELGFITVLDPETFKIEGRIKMVFPEDAKHPAIKRKNENFVLLTDGENLNILLLEPVFKTANKEKSVVNLEENSDSDENETFIAETVIKEQTINKKSKYASYAASASGNNFRGETLPNFQEDLFTYVNLLLLSYNIENIADNIIKTEFNNLNSPNARNSIIKKFEDDEKKISSSNKKTSNANSSNQNSDPSKQEPLINEAQMILLTEIFDCFVHIYTMEECRKALILNNWNPEKTALFLTDNESEIKQPLLIAEKSTLLFQTKIDSISTKNNRVEFKAVKNPIFDVMQFDLLKWTVTKEYVLGYKIKEGACVLFDTNSAAQREFPYNYTERVKIASPSNAGALPQAKSVLSVKANKAKFNVNWKENVPEVNGNAGLNNNSNNVSGNDANENYNLGNKFYMNDEISIEKRILETIRLESFMEAKALGLSGAEQISNTANNTNNNAINSNLASPGTLNENGNLINNYLNEALNMEEIANLSNLGLEKSPSKFINAYLAKNEIKKVIKPQIMRGSGSSVFSTSNFNNNNNNNKDLSINFSSNFGNNPLNQNAFQALYPSSSPFEGFNANFSNAINAPNISGIPAFNNFVSVKDENAKLLQNDVVGANNTVNNNKENKKGKAINTNNNNMNNAPKEFLDNKKKKSKKKQKDSIDNFKEEILSKGFMKRASENVNNNININNNPHVASNSKTEAIEEIILNDSIKGTFIKIVPCLTFLKIDSIFCFDHKNKIYYLLGNNSISLNLMVSNSFVVDAELMENYFKAKLAKEETNEEQKDMTQKKLLAELEEFLAEEGFDAQKSELTDDYMEDLKEFLKKLCLVFNNNKQEMPWKYVNWNYFYLNIYELMNIKSKEYGMYESYSNEYSYPLLPSILNSLENQNIKFFIKKIENSREQNHKQIYESLKLNESEGDRISVFFKPDELRKFYYNPIINSKYDMDNYANWNNLSYVFIESQKEINKNNQKVFLENKKNYYLTIEGSLDNLKFLVEELEANLSAIKRKALDKNLFDKLWVNLLIAFYWSKNSVLVDNENEEFSAYLNKFEMLLHDLFSEANNLKTAESIGFKVLNMLLKIVLAGWMTVCYDLQTQLKWFYIIYDYSNTLEEISPFNNEGVYEIGLKLNLEQAIAHFDKNLFDANLNYNVKSDKYYKAVLVSPFKVLLSIISPDKTNNLLFNFDKINLYKVYELIPIKEDLLAESQKNLLSDNQNKNENVINKTKSFKYISRSYFTGFNPNANSFPFYMLLASLSLKMKIDKESLAEEVIKANSAAVAKCKANETQDEKSKNFNNDQNQLVPNDEMKEITFNKMMKCLELENASKYSNLVNSTASDFNSKFIPKVEIIKKDFENESVLVKIIIKYFRMKKNFTNFKIMKSGLNAGEEREEREENNETTDFLDFESKKLWDFLEKEILEKNSNGSNNIDDNDCLIKSKSNSLIDFIANSVFSCIGDINEFVFTLHSISNSKKLSKYEAALTVKTREFILKNTNLLQKVIANKNTLKALFYSNVNNQSLVNSGNEADNIISTIESNPLDKLDYQVNIPAFKLLSHCLYTLLCKLSIFIPDKTNEDSINDLINLFTGVIESIAELHLDYESHSASKSNASVSKETNSNLYSALKFRNLFNFMNPNSYSGKNIQAEKHFEFLLGNEITQINETVSIPENNLIVVEIDYALVKDKPFNYDLVIISEDHSYNNLRQNSNNNLNNFGTCFNLKLSNSFTRTLFLVGKEVKIMSPIDFEFGKGAIPTMRGGYGYVKNKVNVAVTPKNQRSVLKIKCYPYKHCEFGLILKSNLGLNNLIIKEEKSQNQILNNLDNNDKDDNVKFNLLVYTKLKEFLRENEANEFIVFYVLDVLKTIDYASFKLIRSLIKSISSSSALNDGNSVSCLSGEKGNAFGGGSQISNITSALINSSNINLGKNINQEMISENNKKILSEFLLKNGLKIDILNNTEEEEGIKNNNFVFNFKEIFKTESNNKNASALLGRKSLFSPNSLFVDGADAHSLLPALSLKKLNNPVSEINNKFLESNPSEVLELLEKKFNFYSLTQCYLVGSRDDNTNEDIKNIKNNMNQNRIADYFAKIENTKNVAFDEIIRIIKLINKISDKKQVEENSDSNNPLNLKNNLSVSEIESEINETLKLSSELKCKIRSAVPEPNNYRSIKYFASFTKELKLVWNLVEHLILMLIITYLGLEENIFNLKSDEFEIEFLSEVKKETLVFLGTKLNLVVNWMSAKVQQKKDTFDSLKSYIEFLIDLKEKDFEERKSKIIEGIVNKQKAELDKLTEESKSQVKEKEKEKEEQKLESKETRKIIEKKNKKETNAANTIEELKAEFAGMKGKPKNFKKKLNAKRLYQDISKAAAPKKAALAHKDNKILTEKDQQKENEENQNSPLISKEQLNELSLDSLLNQFYSVYPELFTVNPEELKKWQVEINAKIESDINEAYLGNAQKLKTIMEVNELLFDENNLNDSISAYIKFIKNKLVFYIDCANLCNFESLFKEINKTAMLEVLSYESPFHQMAFKILEKLLFIFEINSEYDLLYFHKTQSESNNKKLSNTTIIKHSNLNDLRESNLNSSDLNLKKINSIKFNSNQNMLSYQQESAAPQATSSYSHLITQQQLILNLNQQKTLDSFFNLIHGKYEISQIRSVMLEQNRRMFFRQLGLDALNALLDSSFRLLIYPFKSLPGILSSCIVKSLEDEVETALSLQRFKNYPLMNLVIHLVNLYNELIEMVNSNEVKQLKISLINSPYGIKDLGQLEEFLNKQQKLIEKQNQKHKTNKNEKICYNATNKKINIIKIENEEDKNNNYNDIENRDNENTENLNEFIGKDLEGINEIETTYHMEMINFVLSDLIILFKRFNESSDLLNNNNINLNKYKEAFELFISNSLKLVYNNQNLKNLNSNKNTHLINDFKENLMIVLSKLVSVKFYNENNQQIYLLREILLENLFKRLEDLYNKSNLHNELISVLEIVYSLSSYINLRSEKDISESSSLNRGFDVLFNIIIASDIHQIITLCCNIFKILFKNFINEKSEFNKSNSSNSFVKEIIKRFYFAVFEKLGSIFVFKNKIPNLSNVSNTISALHSNENLNENNNSNDNDYFVLIHMNSPEIDYQFLVNALYYWEEKYPTKLSLYKYKEEFLEYLNDKNKEKEILDKLNINKQPLGANNNIGNTGQKTKMYNYFNPLKAKNSKISILEKIVDERIMNIKKAIEEGNKFFISKKEKEENLNSSNNTINNNYTSAPNPSLTSPLTSGLDSIKERISKLKQQEAYQLRIKAHLKLAELIGETASIRGYVCLEPFLSKDKAEELAEMLHKAYNHLLPHFKANVEEKTNLFPDELIYPKMPDKDLLLPGCTNILKETTVSYMNVTLVKKSVFDKIENCQKGFFETIKKNALAKSDDKRIKAGLYSNNIFGLSNAFLNSINYNENAKYEQVHNNECAFGASISMIIQELVNLFYEINNTNNPKGFSSITDNAVVAEKLHLHLHHQSNAVGNATNNNDNNSTLNNLNINENMNLNSNPNSNNSSNAEKDNLTTEFINILLENFRKLNLENWKTRLDNTEKVKLLGMLIICCDYYGIIRENTNAIFNNDADNVCKVLSGGHKSGKNKSYVLFTNEENISIEKIEIENLEKKKSNLHLISKIPLFEIIDAVVKAYEIYRDNRDSLVNKMLFQLILKLLQDVKIENNHELIFKIFNSSDGSEANEKSSENKNKLLKLIEILRSISNEIVWLEKEDLFWEKEFIDAFERIYDRIDQNSDLIYSPVFHFTGDNLSENPIEYKKIDCSDLITKYNLPDSNYKKYLPKINDMSKFQTALKNIVNFDRFIVGEIFNYCKSQYRDDEYLNYLYQIRYHLSNGDIASAKSDIHTIFDNNKMPQGMPLPREAYDNKEITKEDCFPGNYYLAKIPNSLLKETKIKGLRSKGSIGINEVPVLLLLIDNSINQALVLYNDVNYSKASTFWINIDDLTFLDSQIKIPANSFKMSELLKEFNYLEKRLRILFCKKTLLKLMKIFAVEKKFNNFEETLLYLHLNDWSNFKLNPISGVFRKFKNFIRIKKNNASTNKNNNNNENIRDLSKENLTVNKNNSAQKALAPNIINNDSLNNEKDDGNDFNLNETIYSCSDIILHKNKFEDAISDNKFSKAYNIENLLSELKINEKPVNELIIQWSMNNWDNLDNHFLKLKTDLFAEYNTRYDGKLRTKEMFHIGNFNKKMLALHELCRFDISNFAGIILSFEKYATLGPQAKISFYSDPYGENLVDEIYSIKTTKSNLETVVFNYPKIWMHYTPGTRAFYIFEWYTQNRDSYLPCAVIFVPHIWTKIVSLTDYSTASLLSDLNVTSENFEILSKFIRKLLNHCTSMSLPAELQRRVFNITNRTILKASKFLSLLEQQKKINFKQFSISKKFSILGIDEFALMRLIDIITLFNEEQKDTNFSSAYIVEGVEIILSILAVIKEPFNILDKYLRETFNYILPIRIEAIIKLGQFLNFFQGTASLEGVLMKEIYDQLKIESQFNNIFLIENIDGKISDNIILEELKSILISSKAKIVDFDKDVKVFENNDEVANKTKFVFVLIDGFVIENLTEKVEEIKEPEPQDDLWECFYCHMENDKDNTFCIFCDKNKKAKPKDKPPKKSTLIKTVSFDNTQQDLLSGFVKLLKNLNLKLKENIKNENEEMNKESDTSAKLMIDAQNDFGEIKLTYANADLWKAYKFRAMLNTFLEARVVSYASDYDYITQKLRIISSCPPIRRALGMQIDYLGELSTKIKKHKEEIELESKSIVNQLNTTDKENKESDKLNESDSLIPQSEKTEEKEQNLISINPTSSLPNINLNLTAKALVNSLPLPSDDFVFFFESLQNNGVDLWLENSVLDVQSRNSEIDIKMLEKLREFIDIRICKEKGFSLSLQAMCLRFVPSHFNSLNCYLAESLETYSNTFRNLTIAQIRFYWTLIKYFNNCLCAALPIIKPPDTYLSENLLHESDEEYLNLPFPKTMSAFLSSARGIAFSITKQNLIRDIIAYTEFSEEQVQIPTFKFERLSIKNNLDNNVNNKKGGNIISRKNLQNFNLNLNVFSGIINANNGNNEANGFRNSLAPQAQLSENLLSDSHSNVISGEEVANPSISLHKFTKQSMLEDLSAEESLYIQAFEQAKDIDPAFFRSKKMPGDPHVGFKVEFKGELVVGIGGPYRQFFSDVSAELQDLDGRLKKLLKLLHPTSNNIAGKGEFKDKFCITPSYNSNTALLYYEFLGLLMGICIRTGVHLTLDLCSLTWKKILSEILTIEDIIEFDDGLHETINFLTNPNLKEEEFESTINLTYSVQLTDGKTYELIPNGSQEKVEYADRLKFLELALKARLCEGDSQIAMIKKGLCKIIPESLLKLLTYKELERLVCGVKTVDLELLKANTKLSPDLNPNSNKVVWLWEILSEISDEEKIKFVKFCWAQERLPSTHEEFQKLQVVFMIKSYLDKTKKDQFPKADTCFFSIELPEYTSKEVMKKKIIQAINLDNVSINADKVTNENSNINTGSYNNNQILRYSEYEDDDYIID